jgi:hypothetical protein
MYGITVIENTDEAKQEFISCGGCKFGCGYGNFEITKEQVQELLSGKCLIVDDDENIHIITLKK